MAMCIASPFLEVAAQFSKVSVLVWLIYSPRDGHLDGLLGAHILHYLA